MTVIHERPTAQIIRFPAMPRFAADGRRGAERAGPDARPVASFEGGVGESWYHAAAIRDAERATKS